MTHEGFYSVYNAGKFDGRGEDHFMFMCYNKDRQPGQASLVRATEAAAHREALIKIGYKPLPQE